MCLPHGNRVLKVPIVHHHIGPQFLFDLVADHAARAGGWNAQRLGAQIAHEFAAVHTYDRGFDRLLFLHFIILAGDRHAPSMETGDAALRVEVRANHTPCLAIWAQYFGHFAI